MGVRNILPIAEPDITSYAHHAFSLSVLHTEPRCLDWVYSNFVQLSFIDWVDGILLDYFSPNAYDHPIPALYGSPRLTRNMILRSYPSFVDFARESIDDGCYVSTYADEYYIPGTVAYQNRSNPHVELIHGYDNDSRQFHVTGFLANQTYGQTIVRYDDMEIAFKDFEVTKANHYTDYTHLFKLNRLFGYDFSVQWVMEQLEEYAFAKPSMKRWQAFQWRETVPREWGINIYDSLIRKIHELIEGTFILDHRPFQVVWEHKKMMNRRIAYMERQGYYACSPEVTEGYARLERSAAAGRHLILKYWMTKDNRKLEELIKLLYKIKTEESLVAERMLQEYQLFVRSDAEGLRHA